MKLPQRIVNISNKVRTQIDKAHLENIRINANNFTVIVSYLLESIRLVPMVIGLKLLNKGTETKHPLYDILIAIAEGKPVQYFLNNQWIDLDPDTSFIINPKVNNTWRVKPKEKVKKYRWVIKDYRNNHVLKVTDDYYANLAEFNARNIYEVWIAVEQIDSTMIEVEADD